MLALTLVLMTLTTAALAADEDALTGAVAAFEAALELAFSRWRSLAAAAF